MLLQAFRAIANGHRVLSGALEHGTHRIIRDPLSERRYPSMQLADLISQLVRHHDAVVLYFFDAGSPTFELEMDVVLAPFNVSSVSTSQVVEIAVTTASEKAELLIPGCTGRLRRYVMKTVTGSGMLMEIVL